MEFIAGPRNGTCFISDDTMQPTPYVRPLTWTLLTAQAGIVYKVVIKMWRCCTTSTG